MPAIFVGVGGIGGSIVAEVRQELKTRVAFAGDTPAARQRAEDFRFLLVDTWKDDYSHGFAPSEVFDLPGGAEAHSVNQRIKQLMTSDPPFQDWWPSDAYGSPQPVGNFDHGAGQLRLKGKLAYRIGLGNTRTVVSAVEAALSSIQGVLRDGDGGELVKIYIVSSLGGGTGSGITLALAEHLHQELPNNCRLVGVFPLASVTELGPPPPQRSSIWANTDAALREIDYAQRVDTTKDFTLTPFLSWGSHDIQGAEPPFQYNYLFGRSNSNGQNLGSLKQYIALIAETLVAESFSTMTAGEGLNTHILSTHSNFIQHLEAHTRIGERSTAYASAAVASLIYPAERIERHLGRRYGIAVLDRMIQINQAQVTSRADDFIKQEALVWDGTPPFATRFEENLETANGQLAPMPRFRKLTSADDEKFMETNKSQVGPLVNQVRTDFQSFVSEQHTVHLRQRRNVIIREYAQPDQGIRRFARTLLIEGGASALGLAYGAVTEVKKTLDRQWAQVNAAIEGDAHASVPSEGSKKDLLALQERWDGALNGLNNGFGKLTNRNGKEAKERFYKSTWRPLRDKTLEHESLLAGRHAYGDLISETQRVQQALKGLLDQVETLRRELALSTTTDVGEHGAAGVLDLAVLDDPRLVAFRFDELLDEARHNGVEDCASKATAQQVRVEGEDDEERLSNEPRTVRYEGIVLDAFVQKSDHHPRYQDQDFRDQLEKWVVDDGVKRLGNQVRTLSIWEALVAEYDARRSLGLDDEAVLRATAMMEQERAVTIQRGAPTKDWQAEAVKYFIGNKLDQVQNRSRPFWQLNSIMPSTFPDAPPAYHFVVIAADDQAYKEAETTLGITGVLEATSERLGAGAPSSLPGRDRIVIYSREGGVPLFYLTEGELADLRTANQTVAGQGKFLYTDRRFVGGVDDVIRPHEADKDVRQFAIAMGLQLGIIRMKSGSEIVVIDSRWESPDAEFSTAQNFERELRDNSAMGKAFFALVDREIEEIRPSARRQEVQQTVNRVRELRNEAMEEDRPLDARFWREADNALQNRLNYGRYFTNV